MIECEKHPGTPRTRLGCCQCHGEELAERDRGARPNWHRGRKVAEVEQDEDAPTHLDEEVQAEIAMTISRWGRMKNQSAAGLTAIG